jgi:hypothetical protein
MSRPNFLIVDALLRERMAHGQWFEVSSETLHCAFGVRVAAGAVVRGRVTGILVGNVRAFDVYLANKGWILLGVDAPNRKILIGPGGISGKRATGIIIDELGTIPIPTTERTP